ncbi:hypothetical protein P170DRAFT_447536 [Aspergillus steynii IBT 23096]|uniref:Cupin type-2 domain-containing protein n=1 Tax=Aspergillus steynii IBT 23096 TaxID=1392250 RepID=A0A2I2G3Z9_9EURO|nr:uncharacterized protein P170DRAFT_447536 [Aspergillus steynii IBT 23096]PLB47598.1 hypothetical protein P170DRAFT_447536 [Aspergillus steynii IBT 23096]
MDPLHQEYARTLTIHHYRPKQNPWRPLGQYFYRIIEDGTHTQYRLSVIESLIPAHAEGPVYHFHEMHDEGFYVTKGKLRFHTPIQPPIDASAGDFVVIPIRMPHKFSNPFDEEAVFVNTISPGFFVRYFEHLERAIAGGEVLTREVNCEALRRFATVPLTGQDIEEMEKMGMFLWVEEEFYYLGMEV